MKPRRLTRRDLLKALGALIPAILAAACGAPTPTPMASPLPPDPPESPPPSTLCDDHDLFQPHLSSGRPVTLVRWDGCLLEALSQRHDELNSRFNEFCPQVRLDSQHGKREQDFVAACAAGAPPDLWSAGANPERLGLWARSGCLRPLDDDIDQTGFPMDRWLPGSLGAVRMDGRTWGFPLGAGMEMLWYNPRHLAEAGLDFPQDTGELWQVAEALTMRDEAGGIVRLGMRPTAGFWECMAWIGSFGGRIWDEAANEPSPDHPGVIAALEDLAAAAGRYGIENLDRWLAGPGSGQGEAQPFMSGDLSLMVDGDWYLLQIDELQPGWQPGEEYAVEAVPFAPQSKLGGEPAAALWVWPQTIAAAAREPQWAFEFLRWLASRERAIQGAVPLKELLSTTCYLEDSRVYWEPARALVRFLASGKPMICPLPVTPISAEYSELISAAVDWVVRQELTAGEAMAQVKAEALELYAPYRD